MNVYLDTEFIEGWRKPLFGRPYHTIELISIALVREDGSYYHALNSGYRYKDASPWVREHVIDPMYLDMIHGDNRNHWRCDNFQHFRGKPIDQITKEIRSFLTITYKPDGTPDPIAFYGYFADYDWVLFCSLFGTMMELPGAFPMYCNDLKQMLYERGLDKMWKDEHCPMPESEHNALHDAKWNHKLHQRIIQHDKLVNRKRWVVDAPAGKGLQLIGFHDHHVVAYSPDIKRQFHYSVDSVTIRQEG